MTPSVVKSRKRREFRSKFKYLVGRAFLFILIPLVLIGFFYIYSLSRPLYISPLPFVKEIQASIKEIDDEGRKKVIMRELAKHNMNFERIDSVDGKTYSIHLKENGEVLVSFEKDLGEQIASLQVINTRLTMEGKDFRKLDLRFLKPVIIF